MSVIRINIINIAFEKKIEKKTFKTFKTYLKFKTLNLKIH